MSENEQALHEAITALADEVHALRTAVEELRAAVAQGAGTVGAGAAAGSFFGQVFRSFKIGRLAVKSVAAVAPTDNDTADDYRTPDKNALHAQKRVPGDV